jgi:hypothetical protein
MNVARVAHHAYVSINDTQKRGRTRSKPNSQSAGQDLREAVKAKNKSRSFFTGLLSFQSKIGRRSGRISIIHPIIWIVFGGKDVRFKGR